MRGQTTILVFFRFGLRATFFLHTKKEGKDVPRGVPLEPRMVLIFRAIVGHHNGGGPAPMPAGLECLSGAGLGVSL